MVSYMHIQVSEAARLPRPHWRATFRSAPLLALVAKDEWRTTRHVYRWKWLAKLAARWHVLGETGETVRSAVVEPYWPELDTMYARCWSLRVITMPALLIS